MNGPVVIDWGNGVRLQLMPVGNAVTAAQPTGKRAGRPPSPATVALREAMAGDAARGSPRDRATYIDMLRTAGGPSSANAAGIIVNREAKRAFGHSLGRKAAKKTRGAGRQPSPATTLLRERLAKDQAANDLRDAAHYVRWVVDQPGVKLGLKQARPIVYRELRAAKN